jgi:hypothetical protein
LIPPVSKAFWCFREHSVEKFEKRSDRSRVNESGGLTGSVRRVVSEEHVAGTQRSYFELPAPVLVGILLLGALLAKNDDDDLTFAGMSVLFLLYGFHIAAGYVSTRWSEHAPQSNQPDGGASS